MRDKKNIMIFTNLIISLIAFVIVISIVVFIHEFGHYIVARLNGVKIDGFSIGFGKEIFGWNDKHGTRWSISMLPLGGYVKMFGDEDASSSSKNLDLVKNMTEEEKKQCLQFKSPLVKIAVAFAGPFFNFLLAVVLLIFVYNFNGIQTIEPIITEIIKDSPAENSDLMVGDKILSINDNKVSTFEDVMLNITLNVEDKINFEILRNNSILHVDVTPVMMVKKDIFGNKVKSNYVGIASDKFVYNKVSFLRSIFESIKTVYITCKSTLISIGQMIVGKRGVDGLSGPIKIAKYSGQYLKSGLAGLTMFIVLISSSLGLMNLLPIPVLDGGLIFICFIELISRKKVSDRFEKYASTCGYVVLVALMIFTTIKDIKDVIFK